jgi:CMP-N-acetylneuraminic acid synthetase
MYKQYKVLGLVMARGGSKGVPGKNIKPLLGKPLVSYTIDNAKESKYIDRLVLSTDDPRIAEIGKQYGCEVPFIRPKELALDDTKDYPVFTHALEWLRENENWKPDLIVHLKPTYPFREPAEIDKGIEMLAGNPKADSVWTVAKPPVPPYKIFSLKEDGFLSPILTIAGEKEAFNWGRQKFPVTYGHYGRVDVTRYETVMNKKSICGENILPFILEEGIADINEPLDWEFAEFLLSKKKQTNG